MGHVLILALDTSSPSGSIAILRDENVIGTASTWTGEVHSAQMFRQLEILLQEHSLGLHDFDLFAVVAGPGSFTGLRVGLTAVKGLAETYNKPVGPVSALEAIAVQSDSPSPVLVPVLDARRGEIYFAVYRRRGSEGDIVLEGNQRVAGPEEFADVLSARIAGRNFTIVTPEPSAIRAALSRLETILERSASGSTMPTETVSGVLAPHVGRLGYLHARRGELADALSLDANYIRRSDAELHLKEPSRS